MLSARPLSLALGCGVALLYPQQWAFAAEREDEVSGVVQEISAGYNSGDFDRVRRAFAADALSLAPSSRVAVGPIMIAASWKSYQELGITGLVFVPSNTQLKSSSAVQSGTYTAESLGREDKRYQLKGAYMADVVRDAAGKWVVVRFSWNVIP